MRKVNVAQFSGPVKSIVGWWIWQSHGPTKLLALKIKRTPCTWHVSLRQSTSSLSVISFDVDCYVLHNCIHIYVYGLTYHLTRFYNFVFAEIRLRMFLFVFLDHVFPSTYPVCTTFCHFIFTYYMSKKCHLSANHVLHEPFPFTSSTEYLTCAYFISPGYS